MGGLYLAYDLLLGFGLQSLQYWVTLLNVPVK